MAYYIKNLGKIMEGSRIFLKLNIEKSDVFLFLKNETTTFSFNEGKSYHTKYIVNNYESEILIGVSGFWQIAIKSNVAINFIELYTDVLE